ncbi:MULTISPECIES: glutathione S-transferase family protein [Psychrobacter]|jgi:glutathione S-transferase|uniref:Glutathione S-transferase-like protein n=1 Tax=Psychrobacter cryohalolentis (strain ATCC BAA-1226 / DSM 17306 / VKM B-2378 / K5) TaxID=335284 RepID=Q1QD02_PSYCK|nr:MULTISPECIES: glutathione S-transferase family protein [Psychrobacter]ABE74451.1 glutathione S-transferase-like protein [Psychrobacter cryohalolentis K5]AGP48265.1 glutathione S-transferase [Psychrobacter sp. G]ASE27076.1 glutathione S-transferase family protein [Psychrobacter cryohalolentis]MBA2058366.1 glutathione S-transferase family protein [Psychrobacter sp. D2]|tara:strand:+ start:329 stop:991 length:663 start_codon:yes stop_codon:yes gene_type:complete
MKKLYVTRTAPNPRKALILLASKGIDIDDMDDLDVIDIDFAANEQMSEAFTKINPMQTVPVLTLDDGTVLNDSQAVCEYLDRVYGERSVMGNDVVQRAQVCSMRRIAEFEVLYNFMLAFQHSHPSKAQRVEQVPEFVAPSIARAVKALAYFETLLEGHEYLVGDQLSFADIVLYLGLDFGKVLQVNPNEQGDNLARFYQMMNERFSIKNMAKAKPVHEED